MSSASRVDGGYAPAQGSIRRHCAKQRSGASIPSLLARDLTTRRSKRANWELSCCTQATTPPKRWACAPSERLSPRGSGHRPRSSMHQLGSDRAPSSPPDMLRMSNITKSFSGTVVLKDVSFLLEGGTIHALLGE